MTQPGQQPATRPLVFISYSHKDEAWKDELLPHLRALELDDQLEVWHDSRIDVGGRWRDEIVQALNRSSVAVCLVSKHFLASKFIVREEIRHFLEQARGWGLPILPLLLNYCPWRSIRWLRDLQILPGGDETIEKHYADSFDEIFAKLADRVSVIVNEPAFAPPPPRDEVIPTIAERAGLLDQNIEVRGHGNEIIQIVGSSNTIVFRERPGADDATLRADEPEWPALAPELVDIERLPVTGAELFGRQAELTLLDEAWAEGKTNVVSLIAWGGVGKSTLVNKWLEGLEADNWRGAARVYGWSFYSQGTGERASSADEFIAEALAFFGDSDPKQGSPWSRGERLAELLRKEKTLLVLDGLEPLQSGHEFEKGRIRDPGLARLIEELARDHQGLCVITTRERVAELDEEDWRACVRQEDLEQLSPEAGRALLRVKGVRGSDAELEQASREFGKHALAISLLANFLRAIPGRPVAAAREIPDLDIPVEKGRHPRRVMAAFAARFGDGPEVELLRVLGLFDRPAGAGPIAALREPPPIPGLTDHIATLDEAGWRRLLARLRDMGLIAPESDHAPDEIDAHPLVREHFGEELREKNLDAWRAGRARLHEHLKATPDKERPLLEDLAPLFQAVFHGCQAGRHQEALDEVYWARIHRHEEYYATKKLGAFGADLAALAGFFEEPWPKPVASITEADQSWVLAEAGYRLRALGRLREALAPIQAALEAMAKREEWERAATSAGNLSELHLALGEIVQAVAQAKEGVTHADQSGDAFQRLVSRTTLADARHQAGEREQALALYREAERMQEEQQAVYPLLYSLQGFQYCDLLLDLGRHAEVRERAVQAIEIARGNNWLLDIALDHISLGRAELLAWQADRSGDLADAARQLDQAVDGLRRAGTIHNLPWGLLARGALCRLTEDETRARRDLDEAMRIARRCNMRLFACDAHLESARLELALADRAQAGNEPEKVRERLARAREHATAAKHLITDTGYHRRYRELADLEARLGPLK